MASESTKEGKLSRIHLWHSIDREIKVRKIPKPWERFRVAMLVNPRSSQRPILTHNLWKDSKKRAKNSIYLSLKCQPVFSHPSAHKYVQKNINTYTWIKKIRTKRKIFILRQHKKLLTWSSLNLTGYLCKVADPLMNILLLLSLRCEPSTHSNHTTDPNEVTKKLELIASQHFWNHCFNSVAIWILPHVWNNWFNQMVLF